MTRILSLIIRVSALALLVLTAASPSFANEIYSVDGVAINGYDAVAYFTDRKPVKGSDQFETTYKGATFRFASEAHRDAFAKSPEQYAPQYGGYCAYGTARGYKATTEPQAFTIVGDKLYLNYNDAIARTWGKDTDGYIKKADANWDTVKVQPEP